MSSSQEDDVDFVWSSILKKKSIFGWHVWNWKSLQNTHLSSF